MKLFTLSLPNGGTLVGLSKSNDKKPAWIISLSKGYLELTYNHLNIWKGKLITTWFENQKQKHAKIIGAISDVTEEMAKEWGYGHSKELPYKFSAKKNLSIYLSGEYDLTNKDLSNILLILVKTQKPSERL